MMWMYIRTGSRSDEIPTRKTNAFFRIRNPGNDEILEMTTRLPELRDRIVAAANVRSSLIRKQGI